LVPARFWVPEIARHFSIAQQLFSLLSFMFLHGGLVHLAGNLWMLYIFGNNIEEHLGPLRYVLLYLLCGIASGLSHAALHPGSMVPVIGASGAIAGVMGAYFLLFPAARILTLIPVLFIPLFVEIPAVVFLGIWLVMQFLNASFGHGAAGGVAWWAHIGGFLFGMVLLKLLARIPAGRFDAAARRLTARKKTDRLQRIRPEDSDTGGDLFGTLQITPFEALAGTKKVVAVPHGLSRMPLRVSVPPGVPSGTVLRLRGLGRRLPGGGRGNLMLKVIVQ
jgi:membrane associated rhomboid family serine protease